jgi:tetratricopeptide (TPR) repeat protein
MRIRSFLAQVARAFALALAGCVMTASFASLAIAQSSKPPSQDEQNFGKAILLSPDIAGKFKAASDLIKKYPKSSLRSKAAADLADEVNAVKDAAQKIALAQQYQAIFKEPSEQQMITPVLIEGLAGASRFEEAFSAGSEFLTRNPDSVFVLVQMVAIGTDQAKQKNPKFVPQSLQYGTHAIELIEADKRPTAIDDPGWIKYKSTTLPSLYQSMGILELVKGERAGAKARLAKAVELAPTDPFNYLLLSGILNEEYQDRAQQYRTLPNGPAKDEELKKVLSNLDQVIDAYAHMIALAEGNERLAPMRQQYLHDLESYYKYRHKGSTEGMQQLIDKYKVPVK